MASAGGTAADRLARLGVGAIEVSAAGRLEVCASGAAVRVIRSLDRNSLRVAQLLSLTLCPVPRWWLEKSLRALPGVGLLPGAVHYAVESLLARGIVSNDGRALECVPYWRDLLTWSAVDEGNIAALGQFVRGSLAARNAMWAWGASSRLRDLRLDLVGGATAPRLASWAGMEGIGYARPLAELWDGVQPTALPFVGLLSRDAKAAWAVDAFAHALDTWSVTPVLQSCLEWARHGGPRASARRVALLAFDDALCGEPRGSRTRAGADELEGAFGAWEWCRDEAAALLSFVNEPDIAAVARRFDQARRGKRRTLGTQRQELNEPAALLHALALLGADRSGDMDQICRQLEQIGGLAGTHWARELLRRVIAPPDATGGMGVHRGTGHAEREWPIASHRYPWDQWAGLLAFVWTRGTSDEGLAAVADQLAARARRCGWRWLEGQCLQLRATLRGEAPPDMPAGRRVVELRRFMPPWERRLELLRQASEQASVRTAGPGEQAAERVVWRVDITDGRLKAAPFLQRPKARTRGWTAGKRLALDKLLAPGAAWMSPEDERVARHIVRTPSPYGDFVFQALAPQAALALVGHPRVFLADDPGQPVEVTCRKPSVHARHADGGILLALEPYFDGDGVWAEQPARDSVVLYSGSTELEQVARALGPLGLLVPAAGVETARAAIGRLAALVHVHSDVGVAGAVTRIDADRRLYLELKRAGDGLRVAAQMRPFGAGGPGFVPGIGAERAISEVAGERVEALRDPAAEGRSFAELVAECDALHGWSSPDQVFDCETLEETLLLLAQLEPARAEDRIVVGWAEGKALRFAGKLDGGALRLRLKSAGEWLALRGEATVNEQKVARFYELCDPSRRVGRFVALEDGAFVELTEELRRELSALESFALETRSKKDELRLHPAAVLALESVASSFGAFEPERAAAKRMDEVRAALALAPKVPRTFEGELRPYQLDGYRWLSRLATLELGACLADDMGLGKTIQILALLLQRAGPSLIVAPTSVCGNWLREARRFAPALRLIAYAEADREGVLGKLGPRDVVVTSYTLLAREIDRLSVPRFDVAVLDEAQAIKNHDSQRARAAFRLQARARIVATGTPIENRLAELYSLFRFLEPGLLGSVRSFNQRFAKPIEKQRDREALDRLRRRVGPFVLRRTKGEVLDELPPRTDVTLRVEAEEDERALYEALRQSAVDKLAEQRKLAPEQRRFVILAELTRLRRACCHPSLGDALAGKRMSGAKLDTLCSLVDELTAAKHRLLVFSQFVDVLALIRTRFDKARVAYEYLDGSTPAKARDERVAAFQSGRGDVFLISTKAGGFGLNLTGADYVVHVDPWWNPAVEDQASDRAHRIGQHRPVTVYRLVMANSIEESILELHHDKRELAESLLSGEVGGAELDVDRLLALLRTPPG